MNIRDRIGAVPKILVESAVIIPFLIVYAFKTDFYISRAPIMELLFLYGVCWLIFRVVFNSICWFSYTIWELLQPAHFLLILFIILVGIHHFNPEYNVGDVHVSDDEMAKDCDDARWMVTVEYDDKNGFSDSYSSTIKANTHDAKLRAEKIADVVKEIHPDCKYKGYSLNLYHLPKDYVRQHRYPDHLFETADLNGGLLMTGQDNGMK